MEEWHRTQNVQARLIYTTKGIISDFHGVALVKWTVYNTATLKNVEFTSYEVYVRETVQLHGTGGGYFYYKMTLYVIFLLSAHVLFHEVVLFLLRTPLR
jgi:hypothetical protein